MEKKGKEKSGVHAWRVGVQRGWACMVWIEDIVRTVNICGLEQVFALI